MIILKDILTLLKYLPEFLAMAKSIGQATMDGIGELQIRQSLKRIDKAFLLKKPQARAGGLNDEFRG